MNDFWNWLGERSNIPNGCVIAFYLTGVVIGAVCTMVQQ